MVEFTVDGRTSAGHLALPASGKGRGVLLLHAWWGLTPFFKDVCEQLAQEGLVVLAPDLYGGGATASTIDEAEQLLQTMDRDETYKTISAAVSFLQGHEAVEGSKLGVVGFSMGGAWALLLEEHIGAIVTFYGATNPKYISAQAAFQGHFAEHDEYEPAEDVRQLEQAIVDKGQNVTFYTYPGTKHWFFERDRPDAYDAQAADLAWRRTVEFLRERLG